jgi:hypothetical protein
MPANARAILIEALRDAHRGLDELLSDPRLTLESLASREGKTVRSIRMTLSLAFLAPEVVKAAVEGRLPRGFGLKRLVDCRWRGRISGGRSGSKRRRRRKERSAPAHLSSTEGLIMGHLGNGILRPETHGSIPPQKADNLPNSRRRPKSATLTA